MEDEQDSSPDVFRLLRDSARARVRLAKTILAAYEANALPQPATPEDITYWENELSAAEMKLSRLDDAHQA